MTAGIRTQASEVSHGIGDRPLASVCGATAWAGRWCESEAIPKIGYTRLFDPLLPITGAGTG